MAFDNPENPTIMEDFIRALAQSLWYTHTAMSAAAATFP